jgi:hypothetical protein
LKKSTYKIWICLLAFFSLFSGVPIKEVWIFGYHFSFMHGSELFLQYQNNTIKWGEFASWLVMVISHLTIVAFPFFLLQTKHFKLWLFVAPAIFLATLYFMWGPFIFAFFPFIVVWLVLLIAKPKVEQG